MAVRIRVAGQDDLGAIQAVYAHHVLFGVGTFEQEPPDVAEIGARMASGTAAGGCWLVAVSNGTADGFTESGVLRAVGEKFGRGPHAAGVAQPGSLTLATARRRFRPTVGLMRTLW